jgi:hypothetical protein
MQLKDLKKSFTGLSYEEQLDLIRQIRQERNDELNKERPKKVLKIKAEKIIKPKKSTKKKPKELVDNLTPEQSLELLKQLGIDLERIKANE